MEGFGPADLDDALCCPPSEADVPDFPDLPEPPGLIDVPPDLPVPLDVPVPLDLPEPPGPEVVDVLVPQRIEVLERDFLPPVRVVITGDPESLAEFSHLQGENSHGFDDTSGFVAVEGVLNAFGVPATEAGLVDYAVDNTLVSETGETSMDFLAQIMTEHGVPAEAGYERTLDYLATDVEQGHGVVVEVNTDLLHHDPLSPYSTELLQSQQVVVTGVMRNEASGAVEGFYVNDPVDGSAGKFVAAADMETAFNGFSIVTDDPLPLYGGEPAGPVPQAPGEPALEPTEAPADVLPLPPEVVEAPAPEVAPVLQFDPSEGTEEVVGPIEDLSLWHEQATNYTCAVVSQEFILEALTGQEFTEEQLAQEAMDQGWLSEAGGTPMDDMGKLLELHGIGVERTVDTSLEDLVSELETGNKVMVAVDSDEVWTAGQDFFADELADMLDYPGAIPGQGANHAVEVVGVDTSDPDHPMVILNDPGHPQGQGLMMPAEEFIDAWADSGSYMVATTGEAPESLPDEGHPYPGSLPAPAAWEERAAATGYNPGQYSGLAATPTPADDDFVAYRRGLLEEIRAEKGDAAAAAQEDAWNNQGGEELREERRQFELEQEKLDPNFSQDEYDARLEQARLIEAEAQRHREETLAEVEVIEEELRENDLDAFRNPYIDDDDDDDD